MILQTVSMTRLLFLLVIIWHQTDAHSSLYPSSQMAMITTGDSPKTPSRSSLSDADYSRKVNVRVSDVLTRQRAAEAASQHYPSAISATRSFDRSGSSPSLDKRSESAAVPMAQIVVQPQHSVPANALVLPMANSHSVIKEDRSWPPEHSQEFARVDVRVMGVKIDNEALVHLQPSSNPASIRKLRKILGPAFQTDWMSIESPPNDSGKSVRSTMTLMEPDNRLLSALDNLNFTVLRPAKGTDVVIPVEMTSEQISLLKDWLIQRATCRMDYIWEDLGSLFWPRWIRRGICVNTAVCSWPPGMRCRPSGSRSLTLLRWVCKNESKDGSDERRRWRRGPRGSRYRRLRRDGKKPIALRRIAREEERAERVRRLIRNLSRVGNGYHCEWSRHEYMVSDQCSCGCE
ncbi:Bone morphogenetic protein antagonist noggin [Paragonimus heterotremus]|uniref:Bone morphogenetic protein antagonist noggin n=1 Tax=Paragonimus heterotremus TaxID=100268 RepID=A0A8J4WJD8_9TREM|nr:Bone morphogenetic protein antagonist noggin [Paragonimus heterotremus]